MAARNSCRAFSIAVSMPEAGPGSGSGFTWPLYGSPRCRVVMTNGGCADAVTRGDDGTVGVPAADGTVGTLLANGVLAAGAAPTAASRLGVAAARGDASPSTPLTLPGDTAPTATPWSDVTAGGLATRVTPSADSGVALDGRTALPGRSMAGETEERRPGPAARPWLAAPRELPGAGAGSTTGRNDARFTGYTSRSICSMRLRSRLAVSRAVTSASERGSNCRLASPLQVVPHRSRSKGGECVAKISTIHGHTTTSVRVTPQTAAAPPWR